MALLYSSFSPGDWRSHLYFRQADYFVQIPSNFCSITDILQFYVSESSASMSIEALTKLVQLFGQSSLFPLKRCQPGGMTLAMADQIPARDYGSLKFRS